MNRFVRLVLMLTSVGLGGYILFGVYQVLSGAGANHYPEAAAVFQAAKSLMPFDTLAGLLLIFWPFYLGWLEEKWKK